METSWPENPTPTNIPLFQRRHFSFPIDINFGRLRKTLTHPYQHNYWNIVYFSIPLPLNTRQIPLELTHSYRYNYEQFSSQFHKIS